MSKLHCWCSKTECSIHNKQVEENCSTRNDWGDGDFCSRGELGLFCDIRYISDKLKEEIKEVETN